MYPFIYSKGVQLVQFPKGLANISLSASTCLSLSLVSCERKRDMSHVTCHMLHVTCQVLCHMSFVTSLSKYACQLSFSYLSYTPSEVGLNNSIVFFTENPENRVKIPKTGWKSRKQGENPENWVKIPKWGENP